MLGVLHIHSTNLRHGKCVKALDGTSEALQRAFEAYLRETDENQDRCGSKEGSTLRDKESCLTDRECYVFIQSNSSSTILGRGGPTNVVKQYFRSNRTIPRASCMIGLSSWGTAESPNQSQRSTESHSSHRFTVQCLRGKLFVRQTENPTEEPVAKESPIDMASAEKIDFSSQKPSTESSRKQISSTVQIVTCGPMNDTSKGHDQPNKHLTETFLHDLTEANLIEESEREPSTHAPGAVHCLHPNEKVFLSTGDSFEINSSGVFVTCYAFPTYADFSSLLAMDKPLLSAAYAQYKALLESQQSIVDQTLEKCFHILSSTRLDGKDGVTPRGTDPQSAVRNIFPSRENTSGDESTQRTLSNSETISNTQFLDIVGHLESFVDETQGSAKKPRSEESSSGQWKDSMNIVATNGAAPSLQGRPSLSRKDMLLSFERQNFTIHRPVDESPLGRYPIESQVVYYEHDDSREEAT